MGVGRASGPLLRAHGAAAERRTPLPMSAVVQRLQDGTLPDNAVAVTFDDGYVDNVSDARPRLAAAGVPATIFLVADAIGQAREFWWDEVARGILGRREALRLRDTPRRSPLPGEVPGGERFGGGAAGEQILARVAVAEHSPSADVPRVLAPTARRTCRCSGRGHEPISGGRESAGRGSHGPADGARRCRAARTLTDCSRSAGIRSRIRRCRCSHQKSAGVRSKKASDVANSWRAVKCAGLRTRTELWTTIVVPLSAPAASRGRARPSPGQCSDRPTHTRCRACSSRIGMWPRSRRR